MKTKKIGKFDEIQIAFLNALDRMGFDTFELLEYGDNQDNWFFRFSVDGHEIQVEEIFKEDMDPSSSCKDESKSEYSHFSTMSDSNWKIIKQSRSELEKEVGR